MSGPARLQVKALAVAVQLALLFAGFFAEDAEAARRKKRKRAPPLAVVVLPFEGKGTGQVEAKEALELELELVEVVQVRASDAVEAEVRKNGARAFDDDRLAGIMKKRGVDILVRGERGAGAKSADVLLVIAYGKDGLPRFFKELPLGSEPVAAAATVVDALRPTLEGWRRARPVKLPVAERGVDLDDVLVDVDAPKEPARVIAREEPARDVLDEPPRKEPERTTERKRSPLDFNDQPVDRTAKTTKKRRSAFDDERDPDDGERRLARSDIGDDGRRRSIDDIEDELDAAPGDTKLAHTFALSGAFDGGTWHYRFDGAGIGDTAVSANFYPGGSALVDVWPVSWLGADAEVALAAVPFKINGGAVAVTPSDFVALQSRIGVAAKLRYTLKNGIGLGGRAGYRFYGASVEAQTVDAGSGTENLTVVPGYQLHALAVGAEVFVPILLGKNRLEIELRADGLPATYYEEAPDNPGRRSLAFGWAVSLAGRYDLASGFFLEGRGQSTGTTVTYSEQGERKAFVGSELQQLQGGGVLNLTAGFSAGVGFMF